MLWQQQHASPCLLFDSSAKRNEFSALVALKSVGHILRLTRQTEQSADVCLTLSPDTITSLGLREIYRFGLRAPRLIAFTWPRNCCVPASLIGWVGSPQRQTFGCSRRAAHQTSPFELRWNWLECSQELPCYDWCFYVCDESNQPNAEKDGTLIRVRIQISKYHRGTAAQVCKV